MDTKPAELEIDIVHPLPPRPDIPPPAPGGNSERSRFVDKEPRREREDRDDRKRTNVDHWSPRRPPSPKGSGGFDHWSPRRLSRNPSPVRRNPDNRPERRNADTWVPEYRERERDRGRDGENRLDRRDNRERNHSPEWNRRNEDRTRRPDGRYLAANERDRRLDSRLGTESYKNNPKSLPDVRDRPYRSSSDRSREQREPEPPHAKHDDRSRSIRENREPSSQRFEQDRSIRLAETSARSNRHESRREQSPPSNFDNRQPFTDRDLRSAPRRSSQVKPPPPLPRSPSPPPREPSPTPSVKHAWRKVVSSKGQTYYFNKDTGESRWDVPEELRHVEIPLLESSIEEEETEYDGYGEQPEQPNKRRKIEDNNAGVDPSISSVENHRDYPMKEYKRHQPTDEYPVSPRDSRANSPPRKFRESDAARPPHHQHPRPSPRPYPPGSNQYGYRPRLYYQRDFRPSFRGGRGGFRPHAGNKNFGFRPQFRPQFRPRFGEQHAEFRPPGEWNNQPRYNRDYQDRSSHDNPKDNLKRGAPGSSDYGPPNGRSEPVSRGNW
ncbi:hypothetical protein BKA69DRAFT_1121924 [Paraphysoderma sedebokerense]|nr:hypothetical protein BKA69DRAFT_1121924 [Paraphysoderma sedebokerense]